MLDEGNFTHHEACECGSSDGKAVYDNGTAYCFVCKTYFGDGKEGVKPKMANPNLLQKIIYKTLSSRNINEDTVRKFGYGYGKHRGKIVQVAPYYNKSGEIVAQHLRTADKDFSWLGKTNKLQLFGQNLWDSKGKRLVITEGELDAMSVAQMFNLKWAVVSVPNGAPSASKYVKENLEWIEGYEEVVFAFDNDEEGRKGASECAILLTPSKAKIANFHPYKDANEMLKEGKGGEIAPRIFQAKDYRPDGIVAGSDLTIEYLHADENILSYEVPYPFLNHKLRGVRKGEMTTIGAGSGVGKSTLAREIAYHLTTNHQQKVGYIALEESLKKSAIGFMAMNLDVPMGDLFLDKNIVPEDDFAKAYKSVIGSDRLFFYDHFGSLDSVNLSTKLKYLAVGLDVDFIVLDHISIVISGIEGGDERRMIDNLMTNLRSLVENTGVGIILISHLRVPQGKQDAHEEGGRVTLNQFRGSGSIKQLSDNIIGMERNQQGKNPDVSKIRLLKNRLFGDVGLCDAVEYNKVTGRLKAQKSQATDEAENIMFNNESDKTKEVNSDAF